MAKRKRIGLIFQYDENWAGGMYYLLNLINSLNYLDEKEKPTIVILYRIEKAKDLTIGLYPYLEFYPFLKGWTIFDRILGKTLRLCGITGYSPQYSSKFVDFVFPCTHDIVHSYNSLKKLRKVYWIQDFQHNRLPHFFGEEEIKWRDSSYQSIADLNASLVLSSKDAANDFKNFYPISKVKIEIIPFASVLPSFSEINLSSLLAKYSLTQPYFISPNQFWKHKNHMVVLKAVSLLKREGYNFKVGFTGKESDYRNHDYVSDLKKFVTDEKLENHVFFLGFIDRKEQLALMKYALAIIQPSIFEGWSSVVEDSKAMNQYLILSNIPVHLEQCQENVSFFDPRDEYDLAKAMKNTLLKPNKINEVDYTLSIVKYAKKLINL